MMNGFLKQEEMLKRSWVITLVLLLIMIKPLKLILTKLRCITIEPSPKGDQETLKGDATIFAKLENWGI